MPQLNTGIKLLFSTLALLTPAPAFSQDAAQTESELEAVSAAIVEISNWLETANTNQSQTQTALREAEVAWSEANNSLQQVANQVADSELQLAELQRQQQSLDAQAQQEAEVLQQIIRATYMAGDSHFLKTLLNQEDPAAAGRMLHYTRVFSSYQSEQISAYQETLSSLDTLGAALEQELDALTSNQMLLAEERSRLASLRTDRESALSALNAEIASRNVELEQLEVDRAELQALLEEIARAMEGIRSFEDVPPLTEVRGELMLPVQGEVLSRFGSSYGGGSLQRQGVIIGSSEGTAVRVIHPGYVAFANWLRGSGLLVVVDHGEGYVSLYGGNQALAVEAGQWIDAGTVIATSGRGTESIGPGLYFELRYQGQAQDPARWLEGLD